MARTTTHDTPLPTFVRLHAARRPPRTDLRAPLVVLYAFGVVALLWLATLALAPPAPDTGQMQPLDMQETSMP